MTHTPGLLRVIEQNELDKTSRCVRLVDSNGVFALAVDEKYGGLVAAAPDMLEVLEWLSNEIDCRDDEYGMVCFTHDDLRKVKAAIQKARGEE